MKFPLILLLTAGVALAQSSERFTVTRSVIADGGATSSSSARFQLDSTIAQPLAAEPSSARFAVRGGYWIWPSPVILVPVKSGASILVSLQTELGKGYTVQYANPPGVTWLGLTNVSGNGGIISVTDSSGASNRLYRLIEN